MCKFFSFISNGRGSYHYADWELRKRFLAKEFDSSASPDSHTTLLNHYHLLENRWNTYEYDPLTQELVKDSINAVDDYDEALAWVKMLDFKTVVPALVIKPIVNPFAGKKKYKVTEGDIALLEQWDSVWASVWDSVRASVWDSVWDSVRASVWDSVGAYISSFFDIKYNYDFTSCIKLWERGFVPSFDGTTWRLHQGKDAKIVYEWKPKGE